VFVLHALNAADRTIHPTTIETQLGAGQRSDERNRITMGFPFDLDALMAFDPILPNLHFICKRQTVA